MPLQECPIPTQKLPHFLILPRPNQQQLRKINDLHNTAYQYFYCRYQIKL